MFDLPNLKILNLSHNKLAILNDQLLTTLNRLKRLDVSHNGISTISESAFKGRAVHTFNNLRLDIQHSIAFLVSLTIRDVIFHRFQNTDRRE